MGNFTVTTNTPISGSTYGFEKIGSAMFLAANRRTDYAPFSNLAGGSMSTGLNGKPYNFFGNYSIPDYEDYHKGGKNDHVHAWACAQFVMSGNDMLLRLTGSHEGTQDFKVFSANYCDLARLQMVSTYSMVVYDSEGDEYDKTTFAKNTTYKLVDNLAKNWYIETRTNDAHGHSDKCKTQLQISGTITTIAESGNPSVQVASFAFNIMAHSYSK